MSEYNVDVNGAEETVNVTLSEQINVNGGGGESTIAWLPTVDASGNISWERSSTTTAPETQNIKGEDGTDGQDGADGLGIKSVDINGSNHLIITYDDDTTHDAGEIEDGGGSSDIPSYYETEYATTKASVESHNTNDSYNVMFMTDLHFSPKGSGYNESILRDPLFKTIKAAKKFVAEVPFTQFVLGGDYMQMPQDSTKEMGISNLAEINETFDSVSESFFPLAGNHEHNYHGDGTGYGLTDDEIYQYLNKKWVGRNGIKKVSIYTYYRIDDVNGVCHVFVSTVGQSATKTAILADFATIVSANTNNYPYLIYNHFGVTTSGTDVESGVKDSIDYIKTTLGKTIIAWISGHKHFDWVKVYNDTLVVSILNSGYYANEEGQDGQTYTKTAGTISESAFSVFSFVPTTGKLFITRFGAGIDMECNYNTTSGAIGRIGYIPVPTDYTITQTLSNAVTSSNSAETISGGSSYSNTLSVPDSHFTISATITMGGVDITSTAYDSATGDISIANVTGDIAITATSTNDYLWTILDSTITQYTVAKPATCSVSGNDLTIEMTQNNCGIKAKAALKSTITGDLNVTAICGSSTVTRPTEDKILVLQVNFLDSTDNVLKSGALISGSSTATFETLANGVSRTFNYSDIASSTAIMVEIRSANGATGEMLPVSMVLSNLRLQTS